MAGEQEIRGTKNLGLIQAIYVGINPPINTKIIWYDDNVGVKIHKYYDVTISQWVPFGFNGSLNISGVFTYLAYSSSCNGQNFNLTFDEEIHTHIAIITSTSIIPNNLLTVDLFENRWIKFCSVDTNGNGNFTYIAFADDDEATNFSLEPSYVVPIPNCEFIDSYIPLNNDLNIGNNLDYTISNSNGGINIDFNVATGSIIEIDLKNQNQPLQSNLDYFVEVQLPAGFNSDLFIRLDENEVGGYFIDKDIQTSKFLKINQSSKLFIEFLSNSQSNFVDELFIKIGSSSCLNPELTECKKYRKCFAIINSNVEIQSQDLVPTLFENKWFCNCCSKDNGDIKNIQNLLNSLFLQLGTFENFVYEEIESLVWLINNLQQNLDNSVNTINQTIIDLQNTLNQNFQDIQNTFQNIQNYQNTNDDNITNINNQITDILNQISNINNNGEGSLSQSEVIKLALDTMDLKLSWKKGDRRYLKTKEEITAGVTNSIYTRNGFISYKELAVTGSNTLTNFDKNLWEVNEIMNLVFKFNKEKFDKLSSYSPKIVIYRYKDTNYKGLQDPQYSNSANLNENRHSGYKLSKSDLIYRPNKIPINKSLQVIDIGQEHYFRLNEEYSVINNPTFVNLKKFSARGLGNKFRSLTGEPINGKRPHKKAWVWLEFALEIDYNGQVLLSKPLSRVKMILTVSDPNINSNLGQLNCIKFKLV